MGVRKFFSRILSAWVVFWQRIEGPELEPSIWHSHYLSHRVTFDLLKTLGSRLRGLIIDVGAGTGHGHDFLDGRQTAYFPTDLPTGRDVNDRRISLKSKGPVHYCSVYQLPFEDARFGGGLLLMVLEHLEFPQKGLREIFRVIEPQGMLLISTPYAFPVHGAPFDFRRWTPEGLKSELRDVGFEIEECVAYGGAFSSVTINYHLALRYHVMISGPRPLRLLGAVFLPIVLIFQGIANCLALILDLLDRSGAFPVAVIALARKPKVENLVCAESQDK